MSKNCYFIVKQDQDQAEKICALCIECKENYYPDEGWFWEGTKNGYGPWLYQCCNCSQVIHNPELGEK